ncbi:LysR family transcriptional regulator [Acidihalobacter ferrooxydans]|uniref:LysR family transcriptional regulator n=1 Tax=Acidihalobacter ferrooxydans TaxID=1765967 RepID=A0A1P8UEG9_9GAMM|nr:LysR family transcriptional regulator [Acidihalobacter ferrooxydans]APZ42247.1 LysR family transcriptional regulator [Acidihalobacter ferrooxydans]
MIKISLRQLEILQAVARHGNFSRASEALHLTQPAVSMQMKQLENLLGMPLFEYAGKRISLTQAGDATLRSAEAVIRELNNLEQSLASLKGLQGGTLTVAAVSTASVFAARLMAMFRTLHPDVQVSLNVVNRETSLRHLFENACDLALMGTPPEGLALVAQPFMDNPLVIIAAAGHPLSKTRPIPLERLLDEPLVVREPASGTRIALENFFIEHRLAFKPAMEMNKNEAIKQAAEAGLGVGLVSLHTVQAELASGQLCVLDVEGLPLQRQWFLVQREGKRLSPAAQAFAELVLTRAAQVLSHSTRPARPCRDEPG